MLFEDTKLINHATVRRAFALMQDVFSKSPDYHAYAVREAELICALVPQPDPDIVAAAIRMPSRLLEDVSDKAVDYINDYFLALDEDVPMEPQTEGGKQLVLAHAIFDLREVRERIAAGGYWGAREAQYAIDRDAEPLRLSLDTTAEKLAETALAELQATQKALDDLVRQTQDKAKFENMGLPDHPTLRAAYQMMRDAEAEHDKMFTNQSSLGANTARVLLETGASTDPDVLGAAILNQHAHPLPPELSRELLYGDFAKIDETHAKIEKYKAEHPDPIEKMFSQRLVDLYHETSPCYRRDKDAPRSAEAVLIVQACHVYILEEAVESYEKAVKSRKDFNRCFALENIEDWMDTLKKQLPATAHPGLKARMEKSLAAADRLFNVPENLAIRTPGSPHHDWEGW